MLEADPLSKLKLLSGFFRTSKTLKENGRGGEIRTHDLLYPKQARYQATLRPDKGGENADTAVQLQPRSWH